MMRQFQVNSYLFGGNAPYVEELYERYLDNPGSVPEKWRAYFDQMQLVPAADGSPDSRDIAHAPIVESFAQRAKANAFVPKVASSDLSVARKQVHVQSIIAAYRFLGNRWANLDPLQRQERPVIPELEPAFYDLTEADMDTVFAAANTYFGQENMTLRDLIKALRDTYCCNIGAEFMYLSDPAQKRWIQQRLESIRSTPTFTAEQKRHILERLTAAEGLERYLHTKYVGQKRFSLEGGESFIAAMDELVQRGGAKGVQEIVIGMAHRGRLNVLVNTLGKMPKELFAEFEGKAASDLPAGDVKYHNGFSSDITTAGRAGAPVAGVQSVAPGDRESGRRGLGARTAGAARRQGGRHGAAGAGARRRGLRRPGRRDGDAEPRGDARLRHRRHGAHRHQQPDRLHHLGSARHAFDDVRHRRREDDRGAGVPRERRRSRGGRLRDAAGDGLPAGVQQGCRHRHHLLPPPGPQRAGHAGGDAAADVQEDRPARRAPASCTPRSSSRRARSRRTSRTRWSRPSGPRWTRAARRPTPC